MRPVPTYSHAVVRQGTPVFLTGQVAWDADGSVVGVGDPGTQAEKAWENIDLVLAEIGATREDIVKLTTYATDLAHLPAIGAVRAEKFAEGRYPASTFLLVAGLADPDLLVEIEVVVVVT
jgi:enamine deaminase RidA (YjgF/YER057c/UK114 family)